MVKAIAVLKGEPGVTGTVGFTQEAENDAVSVEIKLSGLSPGKHGFHVHELGDTSNGCVSSGGHFNPLAKTHGAPDADVRHVGDLGNVVAEESGTVSTTLHDSVIKLFGPNSIIGRTVVVHGDGDDLGLGGHSLSLTTGNAGARVMCGVIGIAK